MTSYTGSIKTLKALAVLQRAAHRSFSYHDMELVEAINHHCALRVAAASAPNDEMVGRCSTAEDKALLRLLRLPVSDLEGVAVKGRYLLAFAQYDPGWHLVDGAIQAALAGMAGAA